jgi:hypothetical protein
VIDYKTGRSDRYQLSPGDPFGGGTRLQLGLYAAAIGSQTGLPVRGRYWFITQAGGFSAVDYEHSGENARRLAETVTAIEEGITQGAFPAVPGEEDRWGGYENCAFCDFDRLCSRSRFDDLARRSGDDPVRRWVRVGAVARGEGDD